MTTAQHLPAPPSWPKVDRAVPARSDAAGTAASTSRAMAPSPNISHPPSAFIMIEVALALVVLTVGILAVFALFGRGVERKSDSLAETQMTLFASGVFNALRGSSEAAASQDAWLSFWTDLDSGAECIRIPAGGPGNAWADTGLVVRVDGIHTIVFTNASLRAVDPTNVVNAALRYRLDVRPPAGQWPHHGEVTLWVWDGQFGSTNEDDALHVYSEFNDMSQP